MDKNCLYLYLDEEIQLLLRHMALILLEFNGNLERKQELVLLKDTWSKLFKNHTS